MKKVTSIRVDTDEGNAITGMYLKKWIPDSRGTIWFENSVKYAYDKVLK